MHKPTITELQWTDVGQRKYLSVRGAGVALQVAKVTGGVLQTEASLVSLCHFPACADLQ